MSALAAPVVAWRRSADPNAPLVVLLHGRGSNEAGIIGLADHLPPGPTYAAVRARSPKAAATPARHAAAARWVELHAR